MNRALAFAVPVALLASCFVSANEDNWWDQSDAATCKFYKRCYTYAFYYDYDDVPDCIDEALDYRDDNEEIYEYFEDECDFDEEKAKSCLSLLGSTCKTAAEDDDYFEDCDEVWDCD